MGTAASQTESNNFFNRAFASRSLRTNAWLVGLLSAIALFQLLTIKPGHGWGDDFAMYIAHARNLVEGRPYSDTGYIYNNDEPIAPRRAPPGLPLMLAPIYALRGADLVAMKSLMVVTFVVALAFLAKLIRRWDSERSALAVIALVGFHPLFWEFKNNVLSDLPFLCFFVISIWLMERTLVNPAPVRAGVALGLAWWAAYATRTLGILLPVAFLLTQLGIFRRLHRSTLVALAVFVSLAALQTVLLQGPSEYLSLFSLQPEAIKSNALGFMTASRGLLDTGFSSRGARAAFAIASVLALTGLIRSWMRRQFLLPITLILYLTAAFLWPYNAGARYLIPVIPFYFFYVVVGLRTIEDKLGRFGSALTVCAASLAFIIYGARYYAAMRIPEPPGIDSPNAQSLFAFFRNTTRRDAVVIFKKPRALALYTGRRAAIYATSLRCDPWQFIDQIHATHVALIRRSRQDSSYLAQLRQERPNSVRQVFANDEFTVYRLPSSPTRGPSPRSPATKANGCRTTASPVP